MLNKTFIILASMKKKKTNPWTIVGITIAIILLIYWLLATYSGAYPFTFRQPIKHKIAFKSTILYPFIP